MIVEKEDGVDLRLTWPEKIEAATRLVTSERLGTSKVSKAPYVNFDGTPLRIDSDYLGGQRNAENPFSGPFEHRSGGTVVVPVWKNP